MINFALHSIALATQGFAIARRLQWTMYNGFNGLGGVNFIVATLLALLYDTHYAIMFLQPNTNLGICRHKEV